MLDRNGAQIIPFPKHRSERAVQRDAQINLQPSDARQLIVTGCWYHESAIDDAAERHTKNDSST